MSFTPFFRIFAGKAKFPTSAKPGYPFGPQPLSTMMQFSSTSRPGSSMRAS